MRSVAISEYGSLMWNKYASSAVGRSRLVVLRSNGCHETIQRREYGSNECNERKARLNLSVGKERRSEGGNDVVVGRTKEQGSRTRDENGSPTLGIVS